MDMNSENDELCAQQPARKRTRTEDCNLVASSSPHHCIDETEEDAQGVIRSCSDDYHPPQSGLIRKGQDVVDMLSDPKTLAAFNEFLALRYTSEGGFRTENCYSHSIGNHSELYAERHSISGLSRSLRVSPLYPLPYGGTERRNDETGCTHGEDREIDCSTKSVPDSREKQTKRKQWMGMCSAQLENLEVLFDRPAINHCMSSEMMEFMSMSFRSNEEYSSDTDCISHFTFYWDGLRFSRLPGRPKSDWASPIGKLHLGFRIRLALSTLSYVQNNFKSLQLEAGIERECSPQWIMNGLVMISDIRGAFQRLYTKHTRRLRKRQKDAPTSREIAAFAADYLFKEISSSLIVSRRRIKHLFFLDVGYTMVSWVKYPVNISGHSLTVDQTTLSLEFPDLNCDFSEMLSELPKANVILNDLNAEACDMRNIELYEEVKMKMSSFRVEIKHEVIEKAGEQVIRGVRTRTLSFLSLACRILGNYSSTSNRRELFRGDTHSFQIIGTFAFILWKLVRTFNEIRKTQSRENEVPLEEVKIGSTSIGSFISSSSEIAIRMKQSKLLSTFSCP